MENDSAIAREKTIAFGLYCVAGAGAVTSLILALCECNRLAKSIFIASDVALVGGIVVYNRRTMKLDLAIALGTFSTAVVAIGARSLLKKTHPDWAKFARNSAGVAVLSGILAIGVASIVRREWPSRDACEVMNIAMRRVG
ncbi:MAG: hypothetical protein JSR80_00985 [Verrucomicrobia bacterium]|nr:hypothetical protein [Verrucomicrobiota bacterium]